MNTVKKIRQLLRFVAIALVCALAVPTGTHFLFPNETSTDQAQQFDGQQAVTNEPVEGQNLAPPIITQSTAETAAPSHGKGPARSARFSSSQNLYRQAHISTGLTRMNAGHAVQVEEEKEDEDLSMPAWARIFLPGGNLLDAVNLKGSYRSDGIPDYVELYSGIEAGYIEDVMSNGIASDSSALLVARDVSNEVLYNGAVRPEHDLGNAFYLLNITPSGHLRIYVGVERLLSDLPTFIEFEFNQSEIRVGSGIPWWEIQGTRQEGDLLVRFNLMGGRLSSVELAVWQDNRYFIFESDTEGLGTGCRDKFSYLYCMGAPPLDYSQQDIEVWDPDFVPVQPTFPDSFAELGIDLDRLALSTRQFSGIYIRTPEDVVMATFRTIGESSSGVTGSP